MPTLSLVLLALVVVFGLLLGERIFGVGALQSMAFQLPELGILSLAMMVTLAVGRAEPVDHRHGQSLRADDGLGADDASCRAAHGFMWGGWQVIAVLAGVAVAAIVGADQRLRHRLPRRLADPRDARHDDDVQGPVDRHDARQRHLRLSRTDRLSSATAPSSGVPVALLRLSGAVRPDGGAAQQARPFGHKIYMIGSSEKATRFSGVDTKRVLLGVYVLSSLLAVVAALVMMARFNSANASYGESYLLVTILAAVLGGVDPFGGFGKVGGLVMALIMLQVISSAFNLLDFSPFLTLAIWGGS